MARSKHFYIRRTHRYLGLILGIQFFLWTVSGLYFSWTDIDEIHGDLQHKHQHLVSANFKLVSPEETFSKLPYKVDSIKSIQLVYILGKPFYSLHVFGSGQPKVVLADAVTGISREPISKTEAIAIATASFSGSNKVKTVEYVTATNGHHEYREKSLPAWAITFDHKTNTTVYVSADIGKVESFRNNKWRIFDFLWMGHTMDYQNRDNINNWLLRIFSAFGLITVLSGFVLFFISMKIKRNKPVRLKSNNP